MSQIYNHINKDYFEKTKAQALKNSKEEGAEDYLYNWTSFNSEGFDVEFKDGELSINGSTDLGFFGIDVNLDMDTVIDIIEFYMKKLGKLKTVLEATK